MTSAFLDEARQHVDRALRDQATIFVMDNVESVLPLPDENVGADLRVCPDGCVYPDGFEPDPGAHAGAPLRLCQSLLDAHPATRLVFTSRESLPAPFDHRHRLIELGALSREEAIELVSQVMKQEGLEPKYDDAGNTPQEIAELVEAVGCHARAGWKQFRR